jgi:hypothetical protein
VWGALIRTSCKSARFSARLILCTARARIARTRMRSQSTPGGDRSSSHTNFRGGAAGSDRDALRVVRATRDQLGVAWSAEADPLFWQVVCWDSRDAAVARLKLSGRHRRATFAALARLQQPFTIAVSGVGDDGSMVWQAGKPIFISGRIALLGERKPPSQCERATTKVRVAKEGGSQCQRSGRRRTRRQASLASQAKRSQRRRPRAGSNRGRSRPAAMRKVGPVIYRARGS